MNITKGVKLVGFLGFLGFLYEKVGFLGFLYEKVGFLGFLYEIFQNPRSFTPLVFMVAGWLLWLLVAYKFSLIF